MIPLEFGAATAITAVLIVGILTLYLLVLKKNGWIGNAASRRTEAVPKEKPASASKKGAARTVGGKTQESEETKNINVGERDENDSAAAERKIVLKQELARKLIQAQKSSKAHDVPRRCNHHFGYLHAIDKEAEIPDECYSCTKLIQCFKEPEN